jgi:hypothetical protein
VIKRLALLASLVAVGGCFDSQSPSQQQHSECSFFNLGDCDPQCIPPPGEVCTCSMDCFGIGFVGVVECCVAIDMAASPIFDMSIMRHDMSHATTDASTQD